MSRHPSGPRSQSRKSASRSAKRTTFRRSRVGALAGRYRVGFGLEQLEDRRVLAAGGLDPTFNPSLAFGPQQGVVLRNFDIQDDGFAVAVQSNGKILVGGTFGDGSAVDRDFAVARFNVDGSLDTTFGFGGTDGINGLATVDFLGQQDQLRDVLIDSAGNILLVGVAQNASGYDGVAIARLDVNGNLDPTFDGDGKRADNFTDWHIEIRGAAIDSAGNIVTAGRIQNLPAGASAQDFVVARYSPTGVRDTAFGGVSPVAPGFAVTDFGGRDEGFDVKIQSSDGRIVVGGRGGLVPGVAHFALARYNTNGTLDTTFDSDGLVTTDIPDYTTDFIDSIAIQVDGKIVAAGSTSDGVNGDIVVARYNTNGTLDTTGFNASLGYSVISPGGNDFAEGVAIQPNGAIVVSGTARPGADEQTVVLRLTSAGVLDAGFGTGGMTITNVSASPSDAERLRDVVITADAKIVAAGAVALGTVSDFLVMRLETGAVEADAGGPYTIPEPGGAIVLNGSSTAGGATYAWDFDADNIYGEASTAFGSEIGQNPTFTVSGVDGPTTYPITLRVTSGSDIVFDSTTVTVENVNPTATFGNNGPVNEGSSATVSFTGQFDPSVADTSAGFRYAYDYDNDLTFEVGNGTYAGSVASASQVVPASYFPDGAGTRTVRARIIDDDGGYTDYLTTVTINNVAPTLTLSGASSVNEGATYTLNLSSSDPGTDTITSWTINWGDGSQVVPGNPSSVTHTYADGPNNYVISATATDEDGTFAAGNTVAVTVNNVAPVITSLTNSSPTIGGAHENQLVSIAAAFTDAGTGDTHTASINWGDGSTTAGAVTESSGSGSVSGSHAYVNGGIYTITVTVTDDDTGQDTETTITVIAGVGRDSATGVLEIVGTNGADEIKVFKQSSSTIKVQYDLAGDPLKERTFSTSGSNAISSIEIYLGDGDDYASISSQVTKDAMVFGNDGNDKLVGGNGNDVLIGGDGLDLLYGRAGRDLLIGGECLDALFGDADGDIIVGGDTDLDINLGTIAGVALRNSQLVDLNAIMSIWTSGVSYSARVAAVLPLANAHFFDDDFADLISGGSGQDLFFSGDQGFIDDVVLDQAFSELEFELLE